MLSKQTSAQRWHGAALAAATILACRLARSMPSASFWHRWSSSFMRAALTWRLCSAYRLCSLQSSQIWPPAVRPAFRTSSCGSNGSTFCGWRNAHLWLWVAARDWRRNVQQCVNAAPLARPGLGNGYLVRPISSDGLGLVWLGVCQTLAALPAVVAATTFAAAVLGDAALGEDQPRPPRAEHSSSALPPRLPPRPKVLPIVRHDVFPARAAHSA